jgi:hypothetical protein
LSRQRTNHHSRSKVIALVAAGAFTVATAASAAATWPQGSPASSARGAHDALAAPGTGAGLTVTDRMIQAHAAAQTAANQALQAYQVRDIRDILGALAAARGQAAQQRAAQAAKKTAAARAAAQASAQSAAQPAGQSMQGLQSAQTTPAPAAAAPSGSPQQIAEAVFGSFGCSTIQFSCLDPLWAHESGWSVTAYNAGSGAYGIPQAVPGSRMASAGPDWQANAATQIRWGLEYIKGTYGSPCGAWNHEQATGWY